MISRFCLVTHFDSFSKKLPPAPPPTPQNTLDMKPIPSLYPFWSHSFLGVTFMNIIIPREWVKCSGLCYDNKQPPSQSDLLHQSVFLAHTAWLTWAAGNSIVKPSQSSCCSVAKSCPILCDPMDCSTPGFPVLHYLLEFAQTHVRWVSEAIQPSHPLPPSFPFVFSLFQHQGFLFQWVGF